MRYLVPSGNALRVSLFYIFLNTFFFFTKLCVFSTIPSPRRDKSVDQLGAG